MLPIERVAFVAHREVGKPVVARVVLGRKLLLVVVADAQTSQDVSNNDFRLRADHGSFSGAMNQVFIVVAVYRLAQPRRTYLCYEGACQSTAGCGAFPGS